MTDANVRLTVREAAPQVRIIDIAGEVTASADAALADAFAQAGAGDAKAVIFNFAGMEYMNSGGIGLLVTTLIRANRNHQQMRAFGLSPHYREILALTRLDEAIRIFEDEASAVVGE